MFRYASILLAFLGLSVAGPATAQSLGLVNLPVVFVSSPVVQNTHQGRAIVATPAVADASPAIASSQRFVSRPVPQPYSYSPVKNRLPVIDYDARDYRRGIAQYGPFRVIDANRVALVGETDASTPRWFRVMMSKHPGLRQLDMIECPGTRDDIANMKLGRIIRAEGMATYVPRGGSVRSGAVELFLAGSIRDIADGAEFAVHSWMDENGREAADFADDAPQNRQYVQYYREMGMSDRQAREFYAMTNSVPHTRALWLEASDMRRWVGGAPARRAPQIAYADITRS